MRRAASNAGRWGGWGWLALGLAMACSRPSASSLQPNGAQPNGAQPESGPSVPAPEGRLPDDVEPVSYRLELEIVPTQTAFSGHAHIELEVHHPVRVIYLHSKDLTLSQVQVSTAPGSAPRPAQPHSIGSGGLLGLELAEPLAAGHASLDLDYRADFNQHLRGLYKVENAGRAYVFSQFEAISARQAFPCFDEPRYKTPFSVRLRVPADATALSNTNVVATLPLPGGLQQLDFAPTPRLPTYLLAFAVGPLDVATAPPTALRSGAPLRGIAAAGRAGDLAFILDRAPPTVAALEEYTGIPYPYAKLDLIAVPDFAYGAMENAGAITFRDSLLLVGKGAPEGQRRAAIEVATHELSHMWFGDLVTMPWWDDVWLNEAFATWMTRHVVSDLHPDFHADFNRVDEVDGAMRLDSMASARQIRQPIESEHDIEGAFDDITYVKGGAVLDTFESYLGRERFRQGIQQYLGAHRFGSATAQDLLAALEAAAQTPVAAAFSSFLDQPGLPRVSVAAGCDGAGPPHLHLAQSRYLPLGSKAERAEHWQIPVCLRYGLGEADARAQGKPSGELCTLLQEAELDLPIQATACPSFVLPNAEARGYYRWSLAAPDFDALLGHLGALSVVEKLSALSNADAAARAGELPFARVLELARQLGAAPERALVEAALNVIEAARDPLLGDAELPAYRALVRGLVQRRAHTLGLQPRQGTEEDGETKLLRPLLFATLALEARDPWASKELAHLGRARLGLEPGTRSAELPSELVSTALAAAVRDGGAPVIERLLVALGQSSDGLERDRLLHGLGQNLNPEYTPRLLGLTLEPNTLRSNELLTLLFAQTAERETRATAYSWLIEHFDAVVERLGKDNAGELPRLSQGACSPEQASRVRDFFTPRVQALVAGPRALQQSLERIELCTAFAAESKSSAQDYLAHLAK
jgi:alanyl aminopeptidase